MVTKSHKRHVPLRSCVVCGTRAAKRDLLRIVATPQGTVQVDTTGRLAGRGAYICKAGNCTQKSLKRGRLEHALRTRIKDEDWSGLLSFLEAASASP